jgi:hypothetical protein
MAFFCKVTPISNLSFVEGLFRLAKLLEATNGTLCNTRHRIPVRSPKNGTKYLAMFFARVQMLFTFLSVPFVASNNLASLNSPSTNDRLDIGH